MSHTVYPVGADLIAYLQASGIVPTPVPIPLLGVDWNSRQLRAVNQFEDQTGRKWIAQSATKIYDPPLNVKGILDLKSELIQLTSITVQGQPIVLNTDFYLGPNNNDQLATPQPWTYIEFLNYFPSPGWPYIRRSISVTGLWGFSVTLPERCWGAMLDFGAYLSYPDLSLYVYQGRAKYKLDGALEEDFTGTLQKQAAAWLANYEMVRDGMKRTTGLL
jgi:hypothetical protein